MEQVKWVCELPSEGEQDDPSFSKFTVRPSLYKEHKWTVAHYEKNHLLSRTQGGERG